MEEFKVLIDVVSKIKTKEIEIIGPQNRSSSNIQALYNDFQSGKLEGLRNEEIANLYFPRSKNQLIYFNRLKRKLHDRLINTLFFIDVNQPNFTSLQNAYQTCIKQSFATKILLAKSARKAAIPLAEKTLRKAEKFEFTEIVLSLARDLRSHYSTIIGDKKAFDKYNRYVKKYLRLREAELRAEEYYGELVMHYVFSEATKKDLLNKSKEYSQELRKVIKKKSSFRLNLVSYLLFVIRFEIVNDYKGTLKICEEALNFFSTKKHLASQNSILFFSMKMLAAQIRLRNFKQAELLAKRCIDLAPDGGTNLFVCLDYYIILSFHSENYQKAYSIYISVISNPAFTRQYGHITERWKIQEAFIYFFILKNKIRINSTNEFKKFRIKKFLNEVPSYSKDKKGTNTIILILHILFLLHQKKYGEIIDRVESLKTYSHRYLRQDDTFRSNCFIKMLLQLPAASFHKKGVLRKAKKYWDKLQTVPLEKANQSVELEIVPYETLWEFVLDSLDNKFH